MKYARLYEHLKALRVGVWTTTFTELECILSFVLPASARRYPAWWANESDGRHVHARAWLDASWRTRDVNVSAEHVTFIRDNPTVERADRSRPTRHARIGVIIGKTAHLSSVSSAVKPTVARGDAPVIALIACAKTTASQPAKAKDLYVSALFRKSRTYVERQGWRWYILSALHGLVDPETVLEPYERILLEVGRTGRQEWASRVLSAANDILPKSAKIVLLAGERYAEFLAPALAARGYEIVQPLAGLGLGRRLAFLDRLITSQGERS